MYYFIIVKNSTRKHKQFSATAEKAENAMKSWTKRWTVV